jgi:hypothetical protein
MSLTKEAVIDMRKDLILELLADNAVKAEYLGDGLVDGNQFLLPFEVRSWEKDTVEIPLGMLLGVFISDDDVGLAELKKAFFKKAKTVHFSKACFVTIPNFADAKLDDALSIATMVSVLLTLDVNNQGYKSVVLNRDLTYQVYNAQKSPKKVADKKPSQRSENPKHFDYRPRDSQFSESDSRDSQPQHETCGEIKTYFVDRGFGFVVSNDGTQTFFHINNVSDPELADFLESTKPEDIQKRHIKVLCKRRKDAGVKYHTAISIEMTTPYPLFK